jgi:hypothetical protein
MWTENCGRMVRIAVSYCGGLNFESRTDDWFPDQDICGFFSPYNGVLEECFRLGHDHISLRPFIMNILQPFKVAQAK